MFNLCTPFNGGLREDVATFMYGVIGRLLPFDQSGWVNTTAMCGTMENVDIGTPLDRLVYYEKIQLQGMNIILHTANIHSTAFKPQTM